MMGREQIVPRDRAVEDFNSAAEELCDMLIKNEVYSANSIVDVTRIIRGFTVSFRESVDVPTEKILKAINSLNAIKNKVEESAKRERQRNADPSVAPNVYQTRDYELTGRYIIDSLRAMEQELGH